MHIYFSGIGGAGIGPLALLARQAGYEVSGSDQQSSQYIVYLKKNGITDIHVGQSYDHIKLAHAHKPIDWLVYSSAVTIEHPNAPELVFCHEQGIKTSKRDEFLGFILQEKKLQLIAIAGTHGKTTTTAMVVWLFKALKQPLSYSLGAKTSFGPMGQYEKDSRFFAYEADEFDRNFLAFHPRLSLISGVSWDHHEIFPTREDYQQAFQEFIEQSQQTVVWQEDYSYLKLRPDNRYVVLESSNPDIQAIKLKGFYNRLDAWLAITAVHLLTHEPIRQLTQYMQRFPGLQRRMEEIIPNLYSDYAHTPEKIRGGLNVALEIAAKHQQDVIVIYEPLTNRRQHYMVDDYGDCFAGAKRVYWLPSYLAREDPKQAVLSPKELIAHLADPSVAEARLRDQSLKHTIQQHITSGDLVVAMAGGGGNSLDDWIRAEFTAS